MAIEVFQVLREFVESLQQICHAVVILQTVKKRPNDEFDPEENPRSLLEDPGDKFSSTCTFSFFEIHHQRMTPKFVFDIYSYIVVRKNPAAEVLHNS